MADYRSGTVANIAWRKSGEYERAVFDGVHWNTESACKIHKHNVTDIRPLVVLDLEEFRSPRYYNLPAHLRGLVEADPRKYGVGGPQRDFAKWLADQIEEQTKPARIPEPGRYGVVVAKGKGLAKTEWINAGAFWRSMGGDPHSRVAQWDDLEDPVLVREGIE